MSLVCMLDTDGRCNADNASFRTNQRMPESCGGMLTEDLTVLSAHDCHVQQHRPPPVAQSAGLGDDHAVDEINGIYSSTNTCDKVEGAIRCPNSGP